MARAEGRPVIGLYETAINHELDSALRRLDLAAPTPTHSAIDAADADIVVAQHLVPLIRQADAAQLTDQRVVSVVALASDIVGSSDPSGV